MKPDWKDAPEWAQWLAQDEDGGWYWFDVEPQTSWSMWMPKGAQWEEVNLRPEDWKATLEGRPS